MKRSEEEMVSYYTAFNNTSRLLLLCFLCFKTFLFALITVVFYGIMVLNNHQYLYFSLVFEQQLNSLRILVHHLSTYSSFLGEPNREEVLKAFDPPEVEILNSNEKQLMTDWLESYGQKFYSIGNYKWLSPTDIEKLVETTMSLRYTHTCSSILIIRHRLYPLHSTSY